MKSVNNRNKILFVVTQSEMGGAQRFVFEVVSNLDKEKYHILVAAGEGDGQLLRKLESLPIKTISLKNMKRAPLPWQVFFSIAEIFNLLKKEKPDTLFLCSTTAGLLGSLSAFFYKLTKPYNLNAKPYIIYRIGGWAFRDPRPFWINKAILWTEKITAPLKDKIIVNSEIDRRIAIEQKLCPPEKIVRIYNGIDPNQLQFLSKEEAMKKICQLSNLPIEQFSNSLIIGTVANFYKTKGLAYFIESVHLLKTSCKLQDTSYKIIIIGEGRQRAQLEELIKKYGLENKVFLAGRIPEAFKYLKAFDIFVLSSLKEGFPWIILEVMAAEIPIIATDVGALPEIIKNGEEGILIPPKNSQQLSEKILELIKNPKNYLKLRDQAKEKLKQFSLQKMVTETEQLL